MSLKDDLMAELEVVVEQLLAEQGKAEELTLSEIEEVVLAAGKEIQARLTGRLVEINAEGEQKPGICPVCGGKLRHKGYREKDVVTRTGEVRVKRAYYYCETCQKGIFPPG
jgi:uncharacterized protein with PIN domain